MNFRAQFFARSLEIGCIAVSVIFATGAPAAGASLPKGRSLIYITNNAGTTIEVVDTKTNKVLDNETIRDIEVPEDLAFSADGKRAYITSGSQDFLFVVDRITGKKIKRIPLSGIANQVVLTRDGKRALVCIRIIPSPNGPVGRSALGALDIIDTASLEKVKSIPTTGPGLHDIVVTKDGNYAIAGAPEGQALYVIDLRTDQIAWKKDYDMRVMPVGIENAPNGSAKRIYIQLDRLNGFAVIDFATHEEVARVVYPKEFETYKVAYPLYGTRAPSHGMAIAPDGKAIWVSSHSDNSVFEYSIPDLKLMGRVLLPELKVPGESPTGALPEWVNISPDGKTVYVSMSALKMVYAIDSKTRKEVARIPTGEEPKRTETFVEP
jgi:YVTN family beta-propeller protein